MIKSILQFSKPYLKPLFWIALVGSYIAAILPQDMAPTLGPLSDKWTHFLAFAVLTLLLRLAYCISSIQTTAVLLFYALFIEFSQYFTPNRCAEVLDVVADAIGIAIGLLLYWILERETDEVY